MSETYDEMKARIKPERYEVVRRESGIARMTTGAWTKETGAETREEPAVWASIWQRSPRRLIEHGMSLNSLTLCIPEGPTGRFPRGVNATDEEIILAVVGDEPIF